MSEHEPIAPRIDAADWTRIEHELDELGRGVLPALLTSAECAALARLYDGADRFRSRVVMGRHGFGRGEYQYFAYPLPEAVQVLRDALYARLAPTAVRWSAALG